MTLVDIREAEARIRRFIPATPLITMVPSGIALKAESLLATGAFKLRGALNLILSLDDAARARGVVAHSSGNHAHAVAYAAHLTGVRAVIVMPNNAPRVKLEATRRWGAEIIVVGPGSAERAERAIELERSRGLTPVPPFDSEQIIAGAATLGVEILEARTDLDAIYVAVSGGGQIAGVAAAAEALESPVEIVAVEPALSGHVSLSLRSGQLCAAPDEQAGRTIADGLRVAQMGEANWVQIRRVVRRAISVSEEEIRDAMRRIAAEVRLVAEPSGAASVAGALKDGGDPCRKVAVLSGGNVDLSLLGEILAAPSAGAPAPVGM